MKGIISFLSLFTSVSTLLCCALPALFVTFGFGAAFAGLVGNFPQLIWISEHKVALFFIGAILLAAGGFLQWRARKMFCPIDPNLASACATARDFSWPIYLLSTVFYLIGAFFAFLAPRIF